MLNINVVFSARNMFPWATSADGDLYKLITSDNLENISPCSYTHNSSNTSRNAVVMDRHMYNSIPPQHRPLGDCPIVIVDGTVSDDAAVCATGVTDEVYKTHTAKARARDTFACANFTDALEYLSLVSGVSDIFVIGHGTICSEAVESPYCQHIFMTSVHSDLLGTCGTYTLYIPHMSFVLTASSACQCENDIRYSFSLFERIQGGRQYTDNMSLSDYTLLDSAVLNRNGMPLYSNVVAMRRVPQHDEMQYLNTVRDIIENGVLRSDRTGTGTLSKFGVQMRFDLSNDVMPLLTTKRVFWRGLAEEMLWFVAGSTDAHLLRDKGVRIWDHNASREFLDERGLAHHPEGDLGPVYGFQWRHFGAEYKGAHADYCGQGVDQLAEVIRMIKTEPHSRRIVLSAWNPLDLNQMALPPCHMFCQFYVQDNKLSCQLYQRSADMGLGVPFNIASYALLTRMIAHVCNVEMGELVHTIGDAHVYLNHVDALREQLCRIPRPFPTLHLNTRKNSIDVFEFSDFDLQGYMPHSSIRMEVSV